MEQNESRKWSYVLIAIIAFLVGFGSAWLYLTKSPAGKVTKDSKVVEKDDETADSSLMLAEPNAVVVNKQKPGIEVNVTKVVFEKGGWVVVHEDDGSGKQGKILGAQLFEGGTWDNGKVELLRGTIEGGKYFAMLHADNGDRAFDPKLDAPIVGKTGSPIMMEFTASESADSGDSEVSI